MNSIINGLLIGFGYALSTRETGDAQRVVGGTMLAVGLNRTLDAVLKKGG